MFIIITDSTRPKLNNIKHPVFKLQHTVEQYGACVLPLQELLWLCVCKLILLSAGQTPQPAVTCSFGVLMVKVFTRFPMDYRLWLQTALAAMSKQRSISLTAWLCNKSLQESDGIPDVENDSWLLHCSVKLPPSLSARSSWHPALTRQLC